MLAIFFSEGTILKKKPYVRVCIFSYLGRFGACLDKLAKLVAVKKQHWIPSAMRTGTARNKALSRQAEVIVR